MSFWYLATPYSKYPDGPEEAFKEASRQAALLVEARVPVFCPIAHTHPVATYGELSPLDHDIWLPADQPFMDAAIGLIVCKMRGWNESYGITHEIKAFEDMEKPIVLMEPGTVPEEVLA